MSPNRAASRLLASAPVFAIAVVVAGLAGADWSGLVEGAIGAAITGVVLVSALIPGVAFGAWAGALAGAGALPRRIEFIVRLPAGGRDALAAPLVAALIVAIGGSDAAVAWAAYLVAAFAGAARSALAALDEGEGRDGVVAAMGRGVTTGAIARRHAFPLAFTRAVAEMGPTVAGLTAGAVIVETVAGLPGAGQDCARAALSGNGAAFAASVAALFLVAIVIDAAGAAFLADRTTGRRLGG